MVNTEEKQKTGRFEWEDSEFTYSSFKEKIKDIVDVLEDQTIRKMAEASSLATLDEEMYIHLGVLQLAYILGCYTYKELDDKKSRLFKIHNVQKRLVI